MPAWIDNRGYRSGWNYNAQLAAGANNIAPDADTNEFFIRLTDAGEMPASCATCRMLFPATSPCLAFSTLVGGIGGLPNLTMPLTAA